MTERQPTNGVCVTETRGGLVKIGTGLAETLVSAAVLLPLPPGVSPEELTNAIDALRASLAPPAPVDPVEELIAAGEAMAKAKAEYISATNRPYTDLADARWTLARATERWEAACAAARGRT